MPLAPAGSIDALLQAMNQPPHLSDADVDELEQAMVWILHRIDAELSAEPMPFDCERIVASGFGWLIKREK